MKEHLKLNGSKLKDGTLVQESLRIQADTPEQLAQRINDMFQKVLSKNGDFSDLVATNFRPQDKDMTLDGMWFSEAKQPNFRQIHGHDGDANEGQAGVTNLNPRAVGEFAPASTVIEYPAKLTDSLIAAIPFV
jgi:hypothetical protein